MSSVGEHPLVRAVKEGRQIKGGKGKSYTISPSPNSPHKTGPVTRTPSSYRRAARGILGMKIPKARKKTSPKGIKLPKADWSFAAPRSAPRSAPAKGRVLSDHKPANRRKSGITAPHFGEQNSFSFSKALAPKIGLDTGLKKALK